MKKNGFMVVECIIASVVILTVIVILYTQVKSVTRSYSKSYSYDNVTSLYALSNFRTFLLNDNNFDKLVENYLQNKRDNTSECGKNYIFISCSLFEGKNINYCDTLLNTIGITTANSRPRQIIFTSSDLSPLKTCDLSNDSGYLRSSFVEYILAQNNSEIINRYMIFAEFDDNTLASLYIYKDSEVRG